MDIHIRIHYHFSSLFWLLACGPYTVASWPPPAKFLQPGYATGGLNNIFRLSLYSWTGSTLH